MLRNPLVTCVAGPGANFTDCYLVVVLASSVIGFLSLRGWTNISLFLALGPALWHWSGNWRRACVSPARPGILAVFCALGFPMLALLISQALREDWIARAYDGPLRMLLAVPVFLHLRSRRIDFARLLWLCAPAALLVVLAEVHLNPDALAQWNGRFATYFVDTDMFGVYVLVLANLCLFGLNLRQERPAPVAAAWCLAGFMTGIYLVVGSQTRASWLALPFVLALWLHLRVGASGARGALIGLSAPLTLVLAFVLFPGALDRLFSGYTEVANWLNGSHKTTSAGYRLTMWHMSWELFKHSPWFGYGDTGFRAYLDAPWITSFASAEERGIIYSGPHNEFLANLLRSGIWGGVSVLGLFLLPMGIFWRRRHHCDARIVTAACMGMAYLVGLMVTSLAFEVFTLKYTASFYGLMIAGLAAQVLADPDAGEIARGSTGSSSYVRP